jgi:DUF971 family protein
VSNFWKHLKPADKPVVATNVEVREDGREVRLTWDDGKVTQVKSRTLRQLCPCAECVDEWTHQRTLDPEKVPEDVTVLEAHAVGNYAISFAFSDQHRTGIFRWPLLRETSEKHPA